MNKVVPNWLHREDTTMASGTALPNTTIYVDNAELRHLRNKIAILESENTRLFEENAEMRKKCMTRFERIQKASPEQMAATIAFIYSIGYTDGREDADDDHHWLEWLQEIGEI